RHSAASPTAFHLRSGVLRAKVISTPPLERALSGDPMSLLPRLPLLALLTCTALPAVAEEPRYNQVSLRSEVSLEVSHDRMQVTRYAAAQDRAPARLAKKVAETRNGALTRARQVNEATLHQGTRRCYPTYEEKGQKTRAWRERAELRL